MWRSILAAALLGVAVGVASSLLISERSAKEWRVHDALPPEMQRLQRSAACVPANAAERYYLALSVDALDAPDGMAALSIGATRFLGRDFFRGPIGTSTFVCDVPELYQKANEIVNRNGLFTKGAATGAELRLIAKLPRPSDRTIEYVAKNAFQANPVRSGCGDPRQIDIRPLARSILAQFRDRASVYADKAFTQISIKDSMGTGAAQIAVAAGHPEALKTTAGLIAQELDSLDPDDTIPWERSRRLYEMAYALYFAGENAKTHLPLLVELMKRKVYKPIHWSLGGWAETHPKQMCPVLAALRNVKAEQLEFDYCHKQKRSQK